MTTAHILHTLKKVIFTLIAVLLSAYVFVILLTYTPNDPSWSRISSDMGQVSNMGGASGAWLSDLMYTFFGWSAWWIMVFIAYEGISIWWQRQQNIGPLRLIGYIFLLLASSGLVANTIQLFNGTEVNAARLGGILGSELAIRLSGLLTVYGSEVFLLIFTILTATFAFDIHWMKVFKEVFSLSWLGNGLRGQSSDDKLSESLAESKNLEDTAGYGSDSESTAYHQGQNDNEHEHEFGDYDGVKLKDSSERSSESKLSTEDLEHADDSHSPLYDQLNLHLPDPTDEPLTAKVQTKMSSGNTSAHNPALNNVLDEFLVNSGLTESIISLHEQEAEEKKQAHNQNADSISGDTSSAVLSKKQEPSFAWNDQNAIDELLDEQALPIAVAKTQNQENNKNQTESTSDTSTGLDLQHVNSSSTDSKPADVPAEPKIQSQTQAEKQSDSEAFNDTAYINPVKDAYQLRRNQPTEPVEAKHMEEANLKPSNSIEKHADTTAQAESPVAETVQEAEAASTAEFVDLTPTNTPPANPKKPHSEEDNSTTSERVTPTIRFATPEGDASNHIEDMVPDNDSGSDSGSDSDSELNHQTSQQSESLPDIHNDAAFASSSRAMQTAKYRENLTPIPEISILDKPDPDRKPSYTQEELHQLSELLEIKLQDFNVKASVKNAIPGPVVTRFEVELAPGVKASKVTGISRDLARSLSMASLRVVEVIPGKPYIGIEVPNKKREMVRLIELLETAKYKDPKAQISMAMGKDIGGKPIITDLARAPHMLVAGTTGSGKSVLVNSMLLSMLLKYKPSELRMILIDPKQLELANYNDIPHLLTPVVTDMNEAASSLSWCVAEMERRYQLMSLLKVRKLGEFNKKVIAAEKAGKPMIDPLWRPNDSVSIDKAPKLKTLPMIVIVADEFADMIMQVGKQAEELITRLAQKSRAAGIHLMLATQRPSVDVITGLIKANIPVRAALRVNSKVDSRTILDAGGAEDMLGNGDMLFLGPGQIEPERVHGAYVSDEEVNRVCDAWRERGAPDYIDNMASNFELTSPSSSGSGNTSGEDDALYDEAVAFIMETRKVSASSIQRKFSIGYNRAARIVDSMEEAGLVSAMGKSGKRELLM